MQGISRRAAAIDRLVAQKRGPELVERRLVGDAELSVDEDAIVCESTFIRTIPLVAKSGRSALTGNLMRRGRQILDHLGEHGAKDIREMMEDRIALLAAIDAIQAAAHKGDWNALKHALVAIDRSKFTSCDAEAFYDDAKEVADFATGVLPKFFVAVADSGAVAPEDEGARLNEYFDSIKDNIFMSGEIVRRERDIAQMRWDALSAYRKARNTFFASLDASSTELRDTWADFAGDLASIRYMHGFRKSKRVAYSDYLLFVSGKNPDYAKRIIDDYEAGMRRIEASGRLRRIREYYVHDE